MAMLQHNQLLQLATFVYLKKVTANTERPTVMDIVNTYYQNGALTKAFRDEQMNYEKFEVPKDSGNFEDDLSKPTGYANYMSEGEWLAVLKNIAEDPQLMALKIENGIDEKCDIVGDMDYGEQEGLCAAFFVDDSSPNKDATFVIRGTNGDDEWYDNGESIYIGTTNPSDPRTDRQKQALNYFNEYAEAYGHTTGTGHSKGGNYEVPGTDPSACFHNYNKHLQNMKHNQFDLRFTAGTLLP